MKDLMNEANRCLLCKNPRCKQSCPINTEIPTIINLYKEGEIKEAGKILFDNNPLSAICGIVCPHENQCAGNCIRGIKGETLGNSHYAIDYLRSPRKYDLGETVVVVGAGNVAMDAARSAKYYGAKNVYLAYRRDFSDMTATKVEINDAIEEGVEFLIYKAPIEIFKEGIILADTKKIIDEEGNSSVIKIEESEELFKCDSVLIAVSQVPKNTIISNNKGIETNTKGLIIIDDEGHTTREGVFSSGDVTHGPKTVVEAVVSSKKVANSIDKYLSEQ